MDDNHFSDEQNIEAKLNQEKQYISEGSWKNNYKKIDDFWNKADQAIKRMKIKRMKEAEFWNRSNEKSAKALVPICLSEEYLKSFAKAMEPPKKLAHSKSESLKSLLQTKTEENQPIQLAPTTFNYLPNNSTLPPKKGGKVFVIVFILLLLFFIAGFFIYSIASSINPSLLPPTNNSYASSSSSKISKKEDFSSPNKPDLTEKIHSGYGLKASYKELSIVDIPNAVDM